MGRGVGSPGGAGGSGGACPGTTAGHADAGQRSRYELTRLRGFVFVVVYPSPFLYGGECGGEWGVDGGVDGWVDVGGGCVGGWGGGWGGGCVGGWVGGWVGARSLEFGAVTQSTLQTTIHVLHIYFVEVICIDVKFLKSLALYNFHFYHLIV